MDESLAEQVRSILKQPFNNGDERQRALDALANKVYVLETEAAECYRINEDLSLRNARHLGSMARELERLQHRLDEATYRDT